MSTFSVPPPTSPFLNASPVLGAGFEGASYNGWAPPDVSIAVGPSDVVEVVNVEMVVYSKSGSLLASRTLLDLFQIQWNWITDPKVAYDPGTGRFVASAAYPSGGEVVLAITNTSDPAGGWRATRFGPKLTNYCLDQPMLGVTTAVLLVTANLYSGSCGSTNYTYLGAMYWVINKTQFATGSTSPAIWASPILFDELSLHPVAWDGPSAVGYMVSTYWPGTAITSNTLHMFTVAGSPPGNVTVSVAGLPMRMASLPPQAPQAGTGYQLDTGDIRVLDTVGSGHTVWLTFEDGCTVGTSLIRACVRLIQVDLSTHAVVQDFDISSPTRYYFYPALSLDASGDLALVFGYSSFSDYPGLLATARMPADPMGFLQRPVILKAGLDAEKSVCVPYVCRYGDYFGAAVDPGNRSVVWLGGEYGRNLLTGWGTRMAPARVKAALTVSYTIRGGGVVDAGPLLRFVVNGTPTSARIGPMAATFLADPGAAWSVDSSFLSPSGAERYVIALSDAGRLTGSGNASATMVLNYTTWYRVNITSTGWGSVGYAFGNVTGTVPSGPTQAVYVPAGVQLNLTAEPWFPLSLFAAWTGSVNGTSPRTSMNVTGPGQLSAAFSPDWIFLIALPVAIVIPVFLLVRRRRRGRETKPEAGPSSGPRR